MTTAFIDNAVRRFIVQHEAYPSPLGYHGYPKSITTSVNNVICHGLPDGYIMSGTEIDVVHIQYDMANDGHL